MFAHHKPHLNIGTIGHAQHGKTTLTAAITKVLSLRGLAEPWMPNSSIEAASVGEHDSLIAVSYVEYESDQRHYMHLDCPGHHAHVKNMFAGASQMDGAILVVSAAEGIMPQTKEHILLAQQANVSALIIFLNEASTVHEEQLELLELDLRDLLEAHGFPGDEIPLVRGNALFALHNRSNDPFAPAYSSILELVRTVDEYLPVPQRQLERHFLMPISDVAVEMDKLTVSGCVSQGGIEVNSEIDVVGFSHVNHRATVASIQLLHRPLTRMVAGNFVKVVLQGVEHEKLRCGQVLATPGMVQPISSFESEVHVLQQDEGGSGYSLESGYCLRFLIQTADVFGTVSLPKGLLRVESGERVILQVKLITPVALEEGARFVIREGDLTMGTGIVTRILS